MDGRIKAAAAKDEDKGLIGNSVCELRQQRFMVCWIRFLSCKKPSLKWALVSHRLHFKALGSCNSASGHWGPEFRHNSVQILHPLTWAIS